MALKTCPECKKQHGPRKKKCECGYSWVSVEPGARVMAPMRGMPEMTIPKPVTRTLTKSEIQCHVAEEGLGYCIFEFIDPSQIGDKKLGKLWQDAGDAMRNIVDYLYDYN